MLRNYLKVSFRNFKKNKGMFLINLIGLSLGVASCMIISLYVLHELSYDDYHQDAGRIYRIAYTLKTETRESNYAGCSDRAAPVLKSDFPQVENAARITRERSAPVQYEDKLFFENFVYYADPDIFRIFTIPVLRGEPQLKLAQPRTAVLSEDLAEKYFGSQNPVGRVIRVRSNEYEVAGVVKNPPSNTHWKYGIILSWESYKETAERYGHWQGVAAKTYLKLREGVSAKDFGRQIKHLAHKYIGDKLIEKKETITYTLQPVTDVHLHSHLKWEFEPPGSTVYLYIYSAAGILILLIACINFINLSTARSANRSSEVGVRKVIGAQVKNLFVQFLGESCLITFMAFLLSIVFVDLSVPILKELSGISFDYSSLFNLNTALAAAALFVITSLAAGAYPAFFLSALQPVSVLKGTGLKGRKGINLRRILVISQFSISILLIIGTLLISKQLNFMKNQHTGFDKEQKLIINFTSETANLDNYEMIKSEFLNVSRINSASFSSSIPGRWNYWWRVWPAGQEIEKNKAMNFFQVDHDFIKDYGLQMAAGRPFDRNLRTDANTFIINEAAASAFGWQLENAVGKKIGNNSVPIIGVLKNYHFRGLQEEIAPLVIYLIEDDFQYLSLSISADNLEETISSIKSKYQQLFPDMPFKFFFLDEDFDMQYRFEERLAGIFTIFAALGIIIAGLGLIGLVSFMTEQRTKEIGIRKVLGATITNIVSVISKEFMILILLSNVIAWPIAWYVMNSWLHNFAYRIDIDWRVFIAAGCLALFMTMILSGFQAVKAALADPVEALRYE